MVGSSGVAVAASGNVVTVTAIAMSATNFIDERGENS